MDRSDLWPRRAPLGWRGGVAALVLTALAAAFSRLFWVSGNEAALIWPPAGIALGLAMVHGLRVLPWVGLGLLAWVLTQDLPLPAWLLPILGGMVAPGAAVIASRRLARRGGLESETRALSAFLFTGLAASFLVGAPLGALVVPLTHVYPDTSYELAWLAYGISEAFGILVFGPLTARFAAALHDGRLRAALAPRAWHLACLAVMAGLVLAQLGLGAAGESSFARSTGYFYFPLLAIAAALGRPLFQDLATALVATGTVLMGLIGVGGFDPPETNAALIHVILLVVSFTVMTQLVSAAATTLSRYAAIQRRAAHRDFLTGLGNDRALTDRLGSAPGPLGLVLLDVDAGRRELELGGAAEADALERSVASSLTRVLPTDVHAARLERGLFAILAPATDLDALRSLAGAVLDAVRGQRHRAGPVSITLDPGCAGVLAAAGTRRSDELLATARLVLRRANASSGRRLIVEPLDDSLLTGERETQQVLERLRSALERSDAFVLMGQRIAPIEPSSADPPWYEVLVRLEGPDGTLEPPKRFLEVAARFGLVVEIDRWVIDKALAAVARSDVGLSINVSGASISDESLPEWIAERMARRGVDPGRVCFEVTETESIDQWSRASAFCAALRERGAHVALDDFGTGLASFEYLRRLPVDCLKIDGSFVAAAETSEVDRTVIESTQRIADALGVTTVAEFVESSWTHAWLGRMGVDHAQGFLVHRPCRLDELIGSGRAAEA